MFINLMENIMTLLVNKADAVNSGKNVSEAGRLIVRNYGVQRVTKGN
jgi:hypothetical protein